MSRASGFTVLEMAVAIAIFAVAGAMAYAGLDRAIAIQARLAAVRRRWQGREVAYYRLADGLAQARDRAVRNGAGALVPPFVIRRAGAGTRLDFTTADRPGWGPGPVSGLSRVGYEDRRGRLLWRRWAVPDRVPGRRQVKEVLMRGVQRFEARVLAPTGLYVRTWPPAGGPALVPAVVKVVLTLDDGRHIRWLFSVGR
ncbi:type II secretion system protein GspJ [Acidiferrobacter sp.]|uniref:type II secretion system protein GspJ n=1 Tax=Acidiferrobacter sp. TaxID=1872107 RepID=UPI0026099448|nr:type II secretion system protein GspJ [Acidiferrobacter sp.]